MGKHEIGRRRKARAKCPAIFLDRDGTIIEHVDDIIKPSQIKILKGAPEALGLFKALGFRLIVITNQPVISKGLIKQRQVDVLHGLLNARFKKQNADIDAFYICPHRHWDYCLCRKPQIDSVKQAAKKYNIDLPHSFFIGDTMRDIATGKNAKLKTILVMTGKQGNDAKLFDVKPDFRAQDIFVAANCVEKMIKKA